MERDETDSAEALGNSPDLKEMHYLKSLFNLHGGCILDESYAEFLLFYPYTIKMKQVCSIHPPEYNSVQEFCGVLLSSK